MKTITRFALAAGASILSLGASQAQSVANLDLEAWTTRTTAVSTGVEAPTNWITDDDLVAQDAGQQLPASFGTLLKTTDTHSGSYAAKLVTDASGYSSYFVLGPRAATSSTNSLGGVPFTGRPANLQFYYKLAGTNAVADSAYVQLELTATVNGASQTVGYVTQVLTNPSATYTLASFPVTYLSAATPDSVHLMFVSGIARHITTGTAVYIDDIDLGLTPTATRNAALNAAVTAAPNPSPTGRYTLSSTEPALLAAPLTVLDVTGRVVRREAAAVATASRELDLSALPAGLYTLQLFTGKGLVSQKLVVQ
ncbi:T9SS type A sorting domain-containing protein [Hymenobacter daeguensis]